MASPPKFGKKCTRKFFKSCCLCLDICLGRRPKDDHGCRTLQYDSTPTLRFRSQNGWFSVITNDSREKEQLHSTFETAWAMPMGSRAAFWNRGPTSLKSSREYKRQVLLFFLSFRGKQIAQQQNQIVSASLPPTGPTITNLCLRTVTRFSTDYARWHLRLLSPLVIEKACRRGILQATRRLLQDNKTLHWM